MKYYYCYCRMHMLGLNAKDGSVVFGQQYGMSDHLSLTLGMIFC